MSRHANTKPSQIFCSVYSCQSYAVKLLIHVKVYMFIFTTDFKTFKKVFALLNHLETKSKAFLSETAVSNTNLWFNVLDFV